MAFVNPASQRRRNEIRSNEIDYQKSLLQFAVLVISRSHYAVNCDINHWQNPSDENKDSHRNIVFDEDNNEDEMKVNALAEHPEVIRDHHVLCQNVKRNTPCRIGLNHI